MISMKLKLWRMAGAAGALVGLAGSYAHGHGGYGYDEGGYYGEWGSAAADNRRPYSCE